MNELIRILSKNVIVVTRDESTFFVECETLNFVLQGLLVLRQLHNLRSIIHRILLLFVDHCCLVYKNIVYN